MFENIGWIAEAKVRPNKLSEFQAVMEDIVAESETEAGTLNYQYYLSDDGDVLVYERFEDANAAHLHVSTWHKFADRWIQAAEPTRMVHLGNLPEDLKERHAALTPMQLLPFGGFAR